MNVFLPSSRCPRRGFTLVELLVVVSIIALLISILLPSLRKARRQAKEVVCASNVRQLGVAMQMYVIEYNCFVPVATTRGEWGRWLRLIDNVRSGHKQAKSSPITQLGFCPTVPETVKALQLGRSKDESVHHKVDRDIAYGYNYIYLGDSRPLWKAGTKGRFPVRPVQIKHPAKMVAIADSDGTGGWCPEPNPYNPAGSDPNAIGHHGFMIDPPELPEDAENGPSYKPANCTMSTKPGFARVSARHREGANVLFVDGHVEWTLRQKLEKDNMLWNGELRAEP